MHLAQATTREEALVLIHWFHAKHRKSSLQLMKEHYRSPKAILEFPNRGRYDLENSCHGLLCFVKCGKEEEAFVSNPLKGEPLMLPRSIIVSRWPHLDRYGLGFDSSTKRQEEFKSIPHQEFSSKVSKWFELVDLRGYLGMVDFSLGTHIEIWKLKDYEKKEWVREYRIDIKPPHGVPINEYIEVVGLMEDGEILLKHYETLVAYNSKINGLRCIQILSGGLQMDTTQVYVYTGSLVSPSQ
uniref:F-box associated beta-propeller type 3 domain-containing protein n=1 Tax=Vitis vinifera TaxID=29760 RepID=A5BV09_VITVI|nr:hypothetical protein VITISV_019896 [Vitis vinifera]